MSNTQDANKQGEAEGLEVAAQNTAPQVSPTADALSDSSLDDVAGGGWPYATTKSAQVTPTI